MGQERYEYRVAIGSLRDNAIELHVQRYLEVGFFKENEEDPYEDKSTYFTALSEQGEVIGVTRLIMDALEELPTIKHFDIYDLDKARLMGLDRSCYAEVSAFTKLPQHDTGIGLLKAIYQFSMETGITHWLCCMDERVYKYMQRMFCSAFKTIGVPKVYLGSLTIPCVLDLSECAAIVEEHRKPLFDYFHDFDTSLMEAVNR
jgi:N-acyl-L-homoserine lactone synthetase